MKLESDLVQRTLDQFESHALPDDHPAAAKLNEVFGDHTFFVDDGGLHIVEPAEEAAEGNLVGKVVTLGHWNDDRSQILLQEPEPSDITIDLGPDRLGPA